MSNLDLKSNLILEIGLEEVPHYAIDGMREELRKSFSQNLNQCGIFFEKESAYSTPRRLILFLTSVLHQASPKVIQKKGMPLTKAHDGKNWTPMGMGFLKTLGLDESLDKNELERYHEGIGESKHNGLYLLDENGLDFLYLSKKEEGVKTKEILPELLKKTLEGLRFDVSMRWSNVDFPFIRPIQYILCFLGSENIVVDFNGVKNSLSSKAHRQIHKDEWIPFKVGRYFESLREYHVIYDQNERRSMILEGIDKIEKDFGLRVIKNPSLLEDVVNLLEYPNVLLCDFDEIFLKLPKELLISQMVKNQYYFPCEDASGNISNKFLVVTNVEEASYTQKGYERVLRARLSDAMFLYEEDFKTSLEVMQKSQEQVEFLRGVTYLEKIERLELLLKVFCENLNNEEYLKAIENIVSVKLTRLYKADLSSKVVYEFPELQGIMGFYYSKNKKDFVPLAIRESYFPLGSKEPLPQSSEGLILSLCDKIINLAICFEKALIPTGSSDPLGLRRDAISIVRMLADKGISFDFIEVLRKIGLEDKVSKDIWIFIKNRLKRFLEENSFLDDEITFLLNSTLVDVSHIFSLGHAVKDLRNDAMFKQFLNTFKRIKNILPKDMLLSDIVVDKALLEKDHESLKALYSFIQENENLIQEALSSQNYRQAFLYFGPLGVLLEDVFNHVLIEDDDVFLRRNRLAIFARLHAMTNIGADFSLLS